MAEENHSTSEVGEQKPTGNITQAEMIARMIGRNGNQSDTAVLDSEQEEQPETETDEQEAKDEPEGEPEVEQSTEDEPEEESTDVLSQIDLDSLSEDEISALADKLEKRAIDRFGVLTKRAKTAEEQLHQLKAQLNAKNNDPLAVQAEIKDNPLSDLSTIEQLRDKAQETSDVIEWAEDVLFNADEYSADDVVVTVEGKELTKADVKRSLLNARKTRDKYLPAQVKVVQESQQADALKKQVKQTLPKELPWIAEESNPIKEKYEAMMADPRLKTLKGDKSVLAQLEYIVAHAANSIFGSLNATQSQKEKPKAANKPATRIKPPSTPSSGAAASERMESSQSKLYKQREGQFKKSGSKNDAIALRMLKLEQKYK